jgi:hypothetical protein
MVITGAIYGSNSIPVYVEDLERMMKECVKLRGKPKILIIQACQGQIHEDGEFNNEESALQQKPF